MIRILLVFISFTSACYAFLHTDIKTYIEQNLPIEGILEQTENGFVYVKVSDNYIYELHKFIQNEGYIFPPYFGENFVGAHITVINSKDSPEMMIEELGLLVTFKIVGCEIVYPQTLQGVEVAYILTVNAPILDAIRRKYGLPEPLFPYHITVGVK